MGLYPNPHCHAHACVYTHVCKHTYTLGLQSRGLRKTQFCVTVHSVYEGEGEFIYWKPLFALGGHFCLPGVCIKIPHSIQFHQQVS